MNGGSDGNGGEKGRQLDDEEITTLFVGAGGAGYMTDGESVCGIPEYDGWNVKNEPKDCDEQIFNGEEANVIAEGGHAYVNGNKGGFKIIVDDEVDSDASGGAGGFGGGGQGK